MSLDKDRETGKLMSYRAFVYRPAGDLVLLCTDPSCAGIWSYRAFAYRRLDPGVTMDVLPPEGNRVSMYRGR